MNSEDQPIEQEQIRYLGDVQRLELRPGDIIVLKLKEGLSEAGFHRLSQYAEQRFPGHKIIILEWDTQIGVLSPTDDGHGSL